MSYRSQKFSFSRFTEKHNKAVVPLMEATTKLVEARSRLEQLEQDKTLTSAERREIKKSKKIINDMLHIFDERTNL